MRPLALALALAAAGCGSTSTYRVVTGAAARPSRAEPRLFLDGASLPSNYAEIAVVQAVGRGNHADVGHVYDGLRAEAAALGADAVISARFDQGTTQASGTGVAVRWIAGPPPAATAHAPRPPSPWTQGATVVAPWATTPR